MKKFLSLVLALVMTMSLVTISAGAKDFTDDSKITYEEAVDVVSAVKVVDGYADGSFNPTATLTRGAAAKIICNLILGPTTAGALSADAAPYKDVPANSTFAGYIAYCAKEGIISGYADGTFRPGNTLTGYAFMKMLLGALGYDKAVEGYEGANWSINVAKRALNIGLNKGLTEDFNGVKPVTREEACLYAFNTLKATMVEYDSTTSISVGGAEVVIAGSKAQDVYAPTTGNIPNNFNTSEVVGTSHTVQFAERYFSKLTQNSKTLDGLKGHTYSYKGDVVSGWAADGDILKTITDGTDVADLVNEAHKDYIGFKPERNALDTADAVTAYVNGVQVGGTYTAVATLAGAVSASSDLRGAVVKFQDADSDGKYDNVSVTKDSVAKVAADPLVKTSGSLTQVTVSGVAGLSKVKEENVYGYEGLKKGDYVLWHTDGTNYFLTKCESVTGKMTDTNNSSKVYIDGESYKVSEINGVQSVANMKTESWGKASTFYLDKGGYVVKAVADEATVDLSNTAYILSTQQVGFVAQAKLLYADGSTQIVNVTKVGTTTVDGVTNFATLSALDETFVTFTKNDSGNFELKVPSTSQHTYVANDTASDNAGSATNGVFTITTMGNAADEAYTITKNSANFLTIWTHGSPITSAPANVLATSNTAFVYDKTNGYTTYTGVANVPSYMVKDDNEVIAYLCNSDGYAIFVVAYGGDKDNTTATVDYVFTTGTGVETYVSASESYWTFPAVVNGEITTIEANSAVGTCGLTKGDLKSVATYDGKRVATADQAGNRIVDMNGGASGIKLTNIDDIVVSGKSVKFMDNGVMQNACIINDNTKFFLFDTTDSDSITEITVDELDALTGGTYAIQALKKSTTDPTVTELFVTKSANSDVAFAVAAYNTSTPATTFAFAAWSGASGADDTANVKAATTTSTTGNISVTVTWAADPNAVVYYSTTAGGTYTAITDDVTVTVSGADVNLFFKVVNNGSTCYYKAILDQA